ncbi:MAG TPA: dihydrolipoamide acetyltransferase family protein [Phycisphaerales bacterium]|nr:dihydrolipoamide acetyltransferase family protein [Phycisphaerales bacterium]
MPSNMTMPRLSDTMQVGTIIKWHVKPGQKVKSGDVVADIETDKATMELQTFDDGVVEGLAVKEGQSCPVGTTILTWQGGSAAPAAKGGDKPAAADAMETGATRGPDSGDLAESRSATASGGGQSDGRGGGTATLDRERVFASPLARKVASDSGVSLKSIEGTGPSGRIVRRDVEAFIAGGGGAQTTLEPAARSESAPIFKPKPLTPSRTKTAAAAATSVPPIAALMMPSLGALEARSVPLSNMRRTIAARLVESKTTVPHYQVTVSARMDALMALRTQLNEQLSSQGVKLSVNDFIVRACALAMHAHPYINSRWNPSRGAETIELLEQVNVGVAISLGEERGGGLVVATVRHADQKGLRMISAETRALAEKARSKGLSIEDMADSTFTISNLGMYGVEHFTAIINPPNVAILAVGGAVEQPVVEVDTEGKKSVGIGHVMSMTMSSDHRVVDGAMAAQYLQTVKQMLEKPATLLV